MSNCKNTHTGILPSDNEDEAKGLEKEAYGEISRRGRPGLWRSSKVRFGDLSDIFNCKIVFKVTCGWYNSLSNYLLMVYLSYLWSSL